MALARCYLAAGAFAGLCLLLPATELRAQCPDGDRGRAGDTERLRHAQVNGVRIAYRVEGAGIPVIFVHGESHSHELWNEQLEAFSRRHLFLSYDRRGHGESEAPCSGYSPVAHAEDLAALMRHLGIRQAHFVVNSRGGLVILQFLKAYPEKVRSIIFADAALALAEPSPQFREARRRNRQPAASIEQARGQQQRAKQAPFYAVARSRPDVRDVLFRMIDQYSLRVAMNPQRAQDSGSPLDIGPWSPGDFPDMAKVSDRVLLMVGDRTDQLFIDSARNASRLWPGTRCHVIRGGDHLLSLEEPEQFNEVALAFLSTIDDGLARGEPVPVGTSPFDATLSGCEPRSRPDRRGAHVGRRPTVRVLLTGLMLSMSLAQGLSDVSGLWQYERIARAGVAETGIDGLFLFRNGRTVQQALHRGEPFDRQVAQAHAGSFRVEGGELRMISEIGMVVDPTRSPAVDSRAHVEHRVRAEISGDRLTLTFGTGTVQRLRRLGPGRGEVADFDHGVLALVDGHFILIAQWPTRMIAGSGTFERAGDTLRLHAERWFALEDGRPAYARNRVVEARFGAGELVIPGERPLRVNRVDR